MKLTKNDWFGAGRWRDGKWMALKLELMLWLGLCLLCVTLGNVAGAQAIGTTTVQGTVYLANGQVGAGTLVLSWPAFTTANGQSVAADSVTVTIAPDGFVSVNLAPNQGATPAGLYYTAVYYLGDGTTTTQYWVVPAAAQASLAQVQAQLMPAAQAVQTVSKEYVDQSIAEMEGSLLLATGGTLSGPLYLSGDPTQALQASDKHYVDTTFSQAVPLAGGNMTGALQTPAVNGEQSPLVGSSQTTLQAAINAAGTNGAVEIPPTYTGTDSFTNPNGVYVNDLRPTAAQQHERSVKEFGAVCDGATDDTNALQWALNYANANGVTLTLPQGTCKTRSLNWRGESIGGLGKQVSALMGFPGQDVLATGTDSVNLLPYTRIHDLTIYVDQSVDVSCSTAEGRAPGGICAVSRLMEKNSIFSLGGNGLTGTQGTGAAWAVGNCAIAMPAATGAGGNGLRVAEIENLEIATTGVDPMAAQYAGVHSTHTCGLYLAQWPQWSEFRNIDIRGLNTGIAIPALPGTAPAGLNSDSNRWQNITIQATHAFTAGAGSNNVLDNVVAMVGNSAATGEPPTGLVLDLGTAQQGWTVRNAVVLPVWNAVQPQLAVTASGGAVTAVTAGPERGLGFDPYGTQVPLKFGGSCTAQAIANVNTPGTIGTVSVTQGGVGCSGTTTASVNVSGTWDTAAPVNLIAGQDMTFFAGNLLKGNGGYTVWNASSSQSNGTQLDGGGGNLPGGGTYAALVANNPLGTALQVDQFPGADFGAKLQACLSAVSATYGGTCDARNFTGSLSMGSNLTISTANTAVLLPCATISTANQVIVMAGTRNVSLRGCALRGGTAASGSQGGTAFLYSGTGAMVQVGDPTYAADTSGFHMDNVVINTTAASSATAQGVIAYRTQELDLESLYFLGNPNQTGITLDGTGNYTGGTFFDDEFGGFQIAMNAIGHQVSNAATTDWMNASAFVRLHIDCPTSAGSPITGTYGINLQQGDGNTFTGGDVEGCNTALHLGANAQNNTIVGLRNENSNNQVVADTGSSYNNWMTGGTMFTGKLTDAGTRNSFLDTFHRSFNGLNGDWYGSQQDATVTNHFRLGIGLGNERGLQDRYQTDFGYRWTTGLSDATAGEQFYQVLDELNSVNRLSIGQYNNGQSSTNNQTVVNAAGTGAVILNGSNNSGTGGVVFGSGGATETTVATIDHAGNAQFNGTLQVAGASQSTGTMTVRNNSDAEVDYYLWPGLTASQKGSFTYKDWNGNSQWFMVKDASNNWSLNSAIGGLDSFKAYQSTNSGDTYVNASNASGVVRVNYETGSGAGFNIYGGSSSSLYASFTGTSAIKFPGLAAGTGHNCLQIDNSGYITNTGSACGTGSGGSGTVGSATSGQIAYYTSTGTSIGGMNQIPLTAGGTGASSASGALASLGAQAAITGLTTDGLNGILVPGNGTFGGTVAAGAMAVSNSGVFTNAQYNVSDELLVNGCNPVTEWDRWQGGTTPTDGFSSCITIPSGAGVTTQSVNAFSAYLDNDSSTLGGGIGGAVGLYASVTCAANSSQCWGMNPLVGDLAGVTSDFLVGEEVDLGVNGAPRFLVGLQINGLNGVGATVPPASNAIEVDRTFGTGVWIGDGETLTGRAFYAGQLLAGNTSTNSQSITFSANSGTTSEQAAIREDPTGSLELQSYSAAALLLSGASAATSSVNQYHGGILIDSDVWNIAGTASTHSQWHLYPSGGASGTPTYDLLNLVPNNSQAPNSAWGVQIPNELSITTAGGTGNSLIQSQTATASAYFLLPAVTTTNSYVAAASAPMPADSIPFVSGLNSVLSYIQPPTVNGIYTAGWNVTAGSAVAPTGINLSASFSPLAGSTGLTTVGTIGTGTWAGNPIASAYGGFGLNWNTSTGIPQLSSGIFSLYNTTCNGAGYLTYTSGTHGCGSSLAPIASPTFTGNVTAPTVNNLSMAYYSSAAIFTIGNNGIPSASTGTDSNGFGDFAFGSLTSGTFNTGAGHGACYNITTGGSNVCFGYNAGRFQSGGSTLNVTSASSTYVGTSTMPNASGDTNEGVYGYAVTGAGSNTEVFGNSSTTDAYFGSATPTAKVHAAAYAGMGTATFAAQAAAGTSPGTPTCATSHLCDSVSGTVSFAVGTSTTTGALLTVTTGITRSNQPNCRGDVYAVASPYAVLPVRLTYTTTTIVFNVGTAPTASTAYELVYSGCGGS